MSHGYMPDKLSSHITFTASRFESATLVEYASNEHENCVLFISILFDGLDKWMIELQKYNV